MIQMREENGLVYQGGTSGGGTKWMSLGNFLNGPNKTSLLVLKF